MSPAVHASHARRTASISARDIEHQVCQRVACRSHVCGAAASARLGASTQAREARVGEQAGREKVAVLGGGPAAITAAFELTAAPELRDRFEVTVYQLGWRLGGKCAS